MAWKLHLEYCKRLDVLECNVQDGAVWWKVIGYVSWVGHEWVRVECQEPLTTFQLDLNAYETSMKH